MNLTAYPLCWPQGWARTPTCRINHSRFKKPSMESACQEVITQLSRYNVSRNDMVISTNVPTRLDGFPKSNMSAPQDKGVAVYFVRKGKNIVLACDSYNRVEDNVWAIAKSLDAMRAIERWGTKEIMDRAFTGFAALPEKGTARTPWDVFGMVENTTSREQAYARFRQLAQLLHPDKNGGAAEGFHELNDAWEKIKAIKNWR